MNMQQVTGLSFLLLFAAKPDRSWAMEDPAMAAPVMKPAAHATKAAPKPAEYLRSDANFYPKADFVKARPTAVVIPKGGCTQQGDSYFFTPKIRAPKDLYYEVLNDWIEPITPPDMPASLGVPPDAMQIREPQGDVEVGLPSAPANFLPATDNMTLPNGAVVKTGANGTAAVLFGGVDSARLMPNSAAAVQQTVTATARSAEVDLTTGGVFSKVGSQVGVKGSYEVHTPSGNVGAAGGDFVTLIASSRTDVWVAQGTIYFEPPDSKVTENVTSDGAGALKIMRFPHITDPHQALMADVETLTAALNFIPLANQKVKALRDKVTQGTTLTDNEQAYLKRIRQVPSLIKLSLVAPPAPPAPVATTPPAPPAAPAPVPGPKPAVASKKPFNVAVHADGTVRFHGVSMDLPAFQSKLADIAKATPDQAFVIHSHSDVPQDKIQAVLDSFHAANLPRVTVAAPTPALPAGAAKPAASAPSAATADMPAPHLSMMPSTRMIPVEIQLHSEGKLELEGSPVTLDELKSRLADIAAATPSQTVVIRRDDEADGAELKQVLGICHDLKLKAKSLKAPAPMPETSPTAADNPATPGLLMHPTMETPENTPLPSTGTTPAAGNP